MDKTEDGEGDETDPAASLVNFVGGEHDCACVTGTHTKVRVRWDDKSETEVRPPLCDLSDRLVGAVG